MLRGVLVSGALLLCISCGATVHGGRGGPRGEVGFSRPPVVDGSRRACLEAPYTPGDAATTGDGSPVIREDEGRRWVLTLEGEREVGADQIAASLDALRERPGLRFISYGLYCGEGSRACLALEGNACELRVDDALAAVRAGIADLPQLAGARLELAIGLSGHLGPRCDERDSSCLPTPYQGDTPYDRLGSRIGGAFASHSGGACDHDGDCMVMGCGNHCLLWEYGGAHEGATCEGYSFPQPIYCGCVERECQWFRQR